MEVSTLPAISIGRVRVRVGEFWRSFSVAVCVEHLYSEDFEMTATFSPENRIEAGLRMFACSGRNLVEIAKSLGVKISHGGFSEQIKKSFDRDTAEKLLGVLERMRDLQEAVGDAPVDWSQTERVTRALTIRRIAQIAAEEYGDHRFDGAAEATVRN
jgi:hypothetical protein